MASQNERHDRRGTVRCLFGILLLVLIYTATATVYLPGEARAEELSEDQLNAWRAKRDAKMCEQAKRLGKDCSAYAEELARDRDAKRAAQKAKDEAFLAFFKSRRYLLDGNVYTRDQLIVDFIRIAFPTHLWAEYGQGEWPLQHFQPSFLEYLKPQLAICPAEISEYVTRQHGHPKFDSLNRWKHELTIGVDWFPSHSSSPSPHDIARIKAQVRLIADDISKAIGVPVRFIEPADETTASYAQIRVVTSQYFYIDNKFKSIWHESRVEAPRHSQADCATDTIPFLKNILTDGVRFTPMARSQVEGYLVSDKDNNVAFAICEIWPGLKDDLFKSLVTECLVRVAGLPESSWINDRAALGHWDKAHDSHSMRRILDGPEANPSPTQLIAEEARLLAEGHPEKAEEVSRRRLDTSFPDALTDTTLTKLTEYDQVMLSLLYCGALAPGMGRLEVLRTLYESDQCFANIPAARK